MKIKVVIPNSGMDRETLDARERMRALNRGPEAAGRRTALEKELSGTSIL